MNTQEYAELYRDASSDLERLEKEVEEVRRLCHYLHGKAGVRESESNGNDHLNGIRFRKVKQIDAATIVLREAGSPLKTREIAKRLVSDGFPAGDISRLKTSLFTTMTRKPTVFEKAGAGLWKLKEADK